MTSPTTPMQSARTPFAEPPRFERIYVWELPVRLFHWLNAACVSVLFATGLYIAYPVFSPSGEAWEHFAMGYVRKVHFATASVFAVNLLGRILWTFLGNVHARSGLPYFWRVDWWRSLVRQAWLYLRLE